MTAIVFALVVVTALIVGRVLSWREVHRQRVDPALIIKPPRLFVDADGRSDFRPELRERAKERHV